MQFVVYTDMRSRSSTIHSERCHQFLIREHVHGPGDHWWHAMKFDHPRDAAYAAMEPGVLQVTRCEECSS